MLIAATSSLPAQPTTPAPAAPAGGTTSAPLKAPLVDWATVQQVHRLVEDWARAGIVPPADAANLPALRVSGVPALRVTLRWLGMTVGVGDALASEQPSADEVCDLAVLARQATVRALAEVNGRLQRQAAEAPADPNKPRPADPLRDVAPQLLVDVQVAHHVERVLLDAGGPSDVVYTQFIAGHHGLRLRRPGQAEDLAAAMMWPGSALASNLTPRSQLLQLLADLNINHDQLVHIAKPQGPILDRFEVIHMVRPSRDVPPTLLQRGNMVLPPGSLDSRTLEAMSQRLVEHLLRWQNPADGTLAGTYQPTSDRHEPPQANAEDEALAGFALTRWAEVWSQSAGESELVSQAQQAAARLVNNVARSMTQEPGPSPAAAALTLLSIHHSTKMSAERKADRDDLVKLLLSRVDSEGGIRAEADPKSARLSVPTQALVQAALAVHVEWTRDPESAKALSKVHTFQWRHKAATEVAALPWLAMVEARAAALELPPAADVPDARARAEVLRQAAIALMQRQVAAPPQRGPADIVGGFDLRPTNPPALAPDPDWQSTYPLLLLAIGTRHQLLQSASSSASDTLTLVLRSGMAARFLAQLMFAEPGCFYVRNVDTTLGGVRLSLWDNRLAIAPHAMTLLAAAELQQTLLVVHEQARR